MVIAARHVGLGRFQEVAKASKLDYRWASVAVQKSASDVPRVRHADF